MKGTYVLFLRLYEDLDVEVGSLGPARFEKGLYAYVGSAFGSGGFKRIERHLEVSRGLNGSRHWHIDYLLGRDCSCVVSVLRVPEKRVECELNHRIDGDKVEGFGSSDCGCSSHLTFLG
ncbi:MAG: GIY-YIG nuclease family protein [Candidatus Nanohaloarchaeota archaeon QJJ-9]|nr:GIY-YIG nuclease family protein [Candidatus Nanohaloarchaeota archaeon QJJ-9]